MRAIVIKIIEIVPGIAFALAVLRFFPPTDRAEAFIEILLAVTLSLLAVTIGDLASLSSSLKMTEHNQKKLMEILSKEAFRNPIAQLFLRVGLADFSLDIFPNIFLEILWSVRKSYHTTIIASEMQMKHGHNTLGLEIQRTKVAAGVDIQRIFIFETDHMLRSLRNAMLEQSKAGIKTRYLLRKSISSNQMLAAKTKDLKSMDFSIIDDAFTLTTFIDPHTFKVNKCRLSYDEKQRREYTEIYSLMWAEATPIRSS